MKNSNTFLNLATDMLSKANDVLKEYSFQDMRQSEERLQQLTLKNRVNSEIDLLRQKRYDLLSKLQSSGKNKELEEEINTISIELAKKIRINSLINKIRPAASQKLFNSDILTYDALTFDNLDTFIISIDIRRSTDLMLKAKNSKLFAQFIVELTTELKKIILDNNGVFDKFTGDGILAYFTEFFSGEDAGYYAVKSAHECHKAFEKIYKKHYASFITIFSDTGLGIGIDYGTIYVDQLDDEHLVVGPPVVYASRLGSAKAGTTLLNQQAIEKMGDKYKGYIEFEQGVFEIKHEGNILVYKTKWLKPYTECKAPKWEES